MLNTPYEIVIGIEVHVQLSTHSKIFCSCANSPSDPPNSNICQICCGHPGVLPVLNQAVVESALKAGLATNCVIAPLSVLARKHYFYPDLPKGYQISQYDKPICTEGYVTITDEEGIEKKIRLIRIHIEEDAGKNTHSSTSGESYVDLNRAGAPLLEIVSYPDISTIYQAKAYLKTLHSIVTHLDISTGNMEEGAFRADTNVSIRKKGDSALGTRTELKNINSFKFIGDAIEFEVARQIELLESGKKIIQETRLWDTKAKKTVSMRSKEEAADYRYFPDPDLPPIIVTEKLIETIKAHMPELPAQKLSRYLTIGLTRAQAEILINDQELARYFDEAYKMYPSSQLINWVLRDLAALCTEQKKSPHEIPMTPARLAQLVTALDKKTINNATAQEIFKLVLARDQNPETIIAQEGLQQIDTHEELEKIVTQVLAENPAQIAQYKSGQTKLLGFFVGACMKKTGGKGNAQTFNTLLLDRLNS